MLNFSIYQPVLQVVKQNNFMRETLRNVSVGILQCVVFA